MKKFMFKTSLFTIPFFLLYFINSCFINNDEGGLTRVGYLYNNPSPKSKILKQFSLGKKYTLLSELNLDTISKFDVLTIGDSFSEQDSLGYKNFLAHEGANVLHMDRYLSENPVQKIVEMINGDFFDYVHVDYIVLQSVERMFVQRCQKINFSKSLQINLLKNKINNYEVKVPKRNKNLFSDAVIKIPFINFQYLFLNKPKYSKTYKVSINNNNLFSGNPNNLLFTHTDIKFLQYKNDSLKIVNSNQNLNSINKLLSEKNIQLIVLVSPDKYDLYYPYIKNKKDFEEPLFFSYYNQLEKEYNYINTMSLLSKKVKEIKDIYYYDDTHWSPITANIISLEIIKIMKKTKSKLHSSI